MREWERGGKKANGRERGESETGESSALRGMEELHIYNSSSMIVRCPWEYVLTSGPLEGVHHVKVFSTVVLNIEHMRIKTQTVVMCSTNLVGGHDF